MKNLCILSTTRLPSFLGDNHPDEAVLFAEDRVLGAAFERNGVAVSRIPWRSSADWRSYDTVLVRSTWDYIDDLSGFFRTLDSIEREGCRLLNPLETLRWNYDKRYLLELAGRGLPVVPTAVIETADQLDGLDNALYGSDLVAKPFVGVGSCGMSRTTRAELFDDITRTVRRTPVLVQPFMARIASEGEWSFVFANGDLQYTARKIPRPGDYRVQVMYGATTVRAAPSSEDRDRAHAVFESLPVEAAYARLDMVRSRDGVLLLMEAELIEPQLYFHDVQGAADRFASAIVAYRA